MKHLNAYYRYKFIKVKYKFIIGDFDCPENFRYDEAAGKCFYFVTTSKKFSAAEDDCKARTNDLGRLLEVRDSATHDYVINALPHLARSMEN